MKNHNSYIITFKKRWPKKKGTQVTQKNLMMQRVPLLLVNQIWIFIVKTFFPAKAICSIFYFKHVQKCWYHWSRSKVIMTLYRRTSIRIFSGLDTRHSVLGIMKNGYNYIYRNTCYFSCQRTNFNQIKILRQEKF